MRGGRGVSRILGDKDRLNQVLTNLIGNAIRHTSEGGEIEVRAYLVEGALRIDVRDSGMGIAREDIAHIFERFYRADDPLVQEKRGTGFGLSIGKMVVEMHGGRIWVESRSQEGGTFTFILPVPVHCEEEQCPEHRATAHLMPRKRSALLVDDDRDVVELVKRLLEDRGYRVLVLGRGRSVVARVEERQPDLILLDRVLPDVEGLEVPRALKENPATADVPVIVQTVVPDDGIPRELGLWTTYRSLWEVNHCREVWRMH